MTLRVQPLEKEEVPGAEETAVPGVTSVAATEVFSKTGHGLTEGDTVSLSNFTQSVEVNGLTAVVSDSSSIAQCVMFNM